jgi:hypothetical protein
VTSHSTSGTSKSKATSLLKSAVKKGVKVLARPLKKLRTSSTGSVVSSHSRTSLVSDQDGGSEPINVDSDLSSIEGTDVMQVISDMGDEISVDLEKELGKLSFSLPCQLWYSLYIRGKS